MAQAGDVLENPITGERLKILHVGEAARGEPSQAELVVRAHGGGPPEHIHPRIEETFEVRSGRLRVRVQGQERIIGPGDKVVVSPGTPHGFWNEVDEEARVFVQARPLLRLDTMLETLFGLARDGKTNSKGLPNPLQMAVIAREYLPEMYLARPPLPVQKVIFGILAPIGKVLGYRARYAKYSGQA